MAVILEVNHVKEYVVLPCVCVKTDIVIIVVVPFSKITHFAEGAMIFKILGSL